MPFSLQHRWFIEPAVLWQIREVPQFQGENRVGTLRVRTTRFGGALGSELANFGEIRVGAERELGRVGARFGDTDEPSMDFQHNEIYTRFSLDTLDSAAFPRRGESATLEWRRQVANRQIERVSDAVNIDYRQRSHGARTPPSPGFRPARCSIRNSSTSAACIRSAAS